MLPDEDPQQFLQALTRVINDPAVKVSFSAETGAIRPAGRPANLDSEAFRVIQSAGGAQLRHGVDSDDGHRRDRHGAGAREAERCYGIGPASDVEDGPKGFGAHSDQERILEAELYRFVQFSYEIVYDLARRN